MIGDGYNISQAAVLGISSMLQSVLGNGGTSSFDNDIGVVTADPIFLQPFYDSDHLTITFESIAASMTNALRAGADTGTKNVFSTSGGIGSATSIYIVQWPWISLPCFLILLGLVFLWLGRRHSLDAGYQCGSRVQLQS
jgi:hypothetical protein